MEDWCEEFTTHEIAQESVQQISDQVQKGEWEQPRPTPMHSILVGLGTLSDLRSRHRWHIFEVKVPTRGDSSPTTSVMKFFFSFNMNFH